MAKQFFKDLPDTTTPLTASRLNGLLDGEEAMGSIVVDDINGKNLANKDDLIIGYGLSGNTGNISANSERNVSEFIEIKPSTEYTVSGATFASKCFYDNSKTFISSSGSNTFTTPSNAKYLRFALSNTDSFSQMQLELGSTVTNYVEYNQPVKKTSIGVKEDTTFYANDFKCKNLFIPTKTNNGTNIALYQATLNMEDDEFVFTATGTAIYFGNIKNTGDNYADDRGILIDVEGISSISYTLTNPLFNQTYITKYDSSKKSLGYVFRALSSGSYDIPAGTKYITLRFGINNTTSGTTYRTKVQIEAGSATPYTPYKQFDYAPVVLWTNLSPSSSFAGQNVTLSDNIANYKYYEVIYQRSTTANYTQSTGKIIVGNSGVLQQLTAFAQKREISIASTTATFTDAVYYGTYGNSTTTTSNTIIIPLQILGYK